MKSGRRKALTGKRHGRVVRAVAVFFLLFTAADIALPQYFCGEEIGGLPLKSRAAAAGATGNREVGDSAFVSRPDNSRPDQPSDPQQDQHSEDCFCCCAHVLPSLCINGAKVAELRSPAYPSMSGSIPSPPAKSTYHPPRIT